MYKISKFLILSIAIVMLVIAPFLCSKANGQTLDTIPAHWWTLTHSPIMRLAEPKFKDTIRVVLLVCDTTSSSWVDSGIVKGKLVQIGDWHKQYRDPSAVWAYGYSVREFSGYYNSNTTLNAIYIATPFYQHIEYLGEDKKPLQFKIVWMAKEIN